LYLSTSEDLLEAKKLPELASIKKERGQGYNFCSAIVSCQKWYESTTGAMIAQK